MRKSQSYTILKVIQTGIFIKFHHPYFAIIPLYHIHSSGMFIVFFLIGVPMLETKILIGNIEMAASPRLPDSPLLNLNSTNIYQETLSCPSLARYIVNYSPYSQGLEVILQEAQKQLKEFISNNIRICKNIIYKNIRIRCMK